jgi:hypothetical protein
MRRIREESSKKDQNLHEIIKMLRDMCKLDCQIHEKQEKLKKVLYEISIHERRGEKNKTISVDASLRATSLSFMKRSKNEETIR